MNKEKVLELAHQADFINKRHNGAEWRWGYIDPELMAKLEKFAELIVRQCGYYADVFSALEYPVDMDPTETKPSDYIKREMGITE
jgi:hypothetical protein